MGLGPLRAGEPPVKILALGDSITRGVRKGVKENETFSSQLQAALRKDGANVDVVNVGIGGERTDQALKRLDALLKLKPKVVTISNFIDLNEMVTKLKAAIG